MSQRNNIPKIQSNDRIYALKIKTESNTLGLLKTFIVLGLIALQAGLIALTYLFLYSVFKWYAILSIVISIISCIHALSSDYNGQAKATWVFFMIFCFSFGYIFYWMSDKRTLFAKSKKKYAKIFKQNEDLQSQIDLFVIDNKEVKTNCNYLYKAGKFVTHTDSKTTYFSSGASLFDSVLEEIKKAEKFIFIEYYIISNGILLDKVLEILKEKVKQGVDVRIIYDDMGSHGSLKRKTKKEIKKAGIKIHPFNRILPIFIIAFNLRDHRKIVIVDGKVSFTGGANLADEYTNEKRLHGYWKDEGIKIEGRATDNFTIAFLSQWQFLTNSEEDYSQFLNQAQAVESDGVVVPYVTGPHYPYSIAQNMYANEIANSKEKLYIMTPYFVPDETIRNLLIDKARSGVDVRLVLPAIADKNFVYCVSRNNAEKLIEHGVKVYTMTSSFVHSKMMLTENSAIVGSINLDLRSFNQQFESAVFTSEQSTLNEINNDFEKTISYSEEITLKNQKRNKLSYRIIAGIFNLVSPFM